jgi:hypothetical protein
MRVVIRIPQSFLDSVIEDLSRPHPLAAERVGFIFTKSSRAGPGQVIVLPTTYTPVDDKHYIDDPTVAVRINSDAIRMAHQRSRDSSHGCLHVHMHPGSSRPWFSRVDLETLQGLSPSLRRMASAAVHGGLVLAGTRASGLVWAPGEARPAEADVSIIGFPMTLERSCHRE